MGDERNATVPGRRAPQQERSRQSTARILAAASELFGTQGFDRTTLVQVGKRAGYSAALVTRHFGSKEGLLRALIEQLTEDSPASTSTLEEALDGDFPPGTTGRMAEPIAFMAAAEPLQVRSVFGILFEALRAEPAALHDHVLGLHRSDRAAIAAALRQGIAAGHIEPTIDPDVFAGLILSALRGAIYQWLLDPTFDFAADIRAHARLLDEALVPRG